MKEMSMRPQSVLSRRLAVGGLFELVQVKSYEEISITDICRQGGISRQTFYRNFDRKEDIIIYYVDHLINGYMARAESNMEKDLELFFCNLPFSLEFLAFLKRNRLMYLLKESFLHLIEGYMREHSFHVLLDDHIYDTYLSAFIVDTAVSILDSWVSRDFRESGQELYCIMKAFLEGVGKC